MMASRLGSRRRNWLRSSPGHKRNMDEGAAQRLRAAFSATRERAQTFDQGPVGDVLRNAADPPNYRLPGFAVPGKVWVPGPRGAQTVQAYGEAAGSKAVSKRRRQRAFGARR